MSVASAVELELPRYELVGAPAAPTIAVLGGISADRHVCATAGHPGAGWWESCAGPGRTLDPARFRILGCDFLDGGRGPDGRPARIVTTHDQADALAAVLDEAGIARLHALVGASYGGMVALAFAERYPERVERLIVLGAAHSAHPMVTALRAIQRRIVELGLDTGRARDALALARELAMTTYRSAREFAERFDSSADLLTGNDAVFPVEKYLRHHGERFAATWRPERFLALSLSADLHQVDPALVKAATTLVAFEGDAIVPREDIAALARGIAGPCRIIDLPSRTGHDAFLTESDSLGPILLDALFASLS
jgi:homoserine O-acetyltransferase